ncbi:MAG TPA: hypothetical protein VIT44_19255, partial [Cyclobacteriaceae bacterium]
MKQNLILFLFLLAGTGTWAQNTKALADAQRYFSIKNYEQALPLYLEAINSGVKDPIAFHQAGICYQKSDDLNQQVKAIPFFENALKVGKGMAPSVGYELGELYLKNEELEKAIHQFTIYK